MEIFLMRPTIDLKNLVVTAFIAMAAGTSAAQTYPVKPIRMIVPVEPGGSVDIAGRSIAPRMTEFLGQPVIVENRSGAAGQIGALQVARSAPDGYTILIAIGAAHALSLYAYKSLPYHPVNDFTPITTIADTILGIWGAANFPPNNLRQAIDYAKANPAKVSYGHTGVGGITHLAMEQINQLGGSDFQHIPFKGGAPITVSMVSGQLQMGAVPLATLLPQMRAGKVKLLAILGAKRYPGLPDMPIVSEMVPGFQMLEATGTWVLGPAGMPGPIVARLHESIAKAAFSPEVKEKLEAGGQIPNGQSPAALTAQFKSTMELAGRLMKLANVQPE
jgi:tripartite-type tricarboxylate transporter receptor subunit TctC